MIALLCIWFGIPALVMVAQAACAAYDAIRTLFAWYRTTRPMFRASLVLRPLMWRVVLAPALNATFITIELVRDVAIIIAECVIPNPDYSD